MKQIILLFYSFLVFGLTLVKAQDIALYSQFNGRYDFTFIGNTLNTEENGSGGSCSILTQSAANLTLSSSDIIESAYLYWAGSGTGDFQVSLNGQTIAATRQFTVTQPGPNRPFFSAFADITSQIKTTGNATYTLTDLDLTAVISDYCTNGTNFGGWAIIIVYKNNALPLNQLNVYDGLQFVPTAVNITLNNLDVIDNQDAKIGFLAWEGDRNIANNESLKINGNPLSNALNPVNNAFNGTNSFTGATDLFNMDLDVYSIQNNIAIGDTSATIQMTSSQDFVMINAIVTKLNSQLPDATIKTTNITQACNTRQLHIDYTVSNLNSTNFLPSGTFSTFYANNVPIGTGQTTEIIPIGESRNYQIIVTIPTSIPKTFQLKCLVDDNNGVASVTETDETNNFFTEEITLWLSPEFNVLKNITACNDGNTKGTFNFSAYEEFVKIDPLHNVGFFENSIDANANNNQILNTTNYIALTTPKTIYIRIEDEYCYAITSFDLLTNPCPPTVYNHFTANNDGYNDTFFIEGLRNIFLNHKLCIYNRWGELVWEGNNNTPEWDGYCNQKNIIYKGSLPAGTYYYVLDLNEPNYESLSGFVYLNR
jgi:gliding motility-associated-like protein